MSPSESRTDKTPRFIKQKCIRMLKIALPHIGLYLFLFFYLLGGAWTFARIETSTDRFHQLEKLERVRNVYREIAIAATDSCPISSALDPDFRPHIFNSLSKLSSLMEGREFWLNADDEMADDEKLFAPRWSKMASILYALSILTTTGYTSSTPTTLLGQWVAIGYGLIGIPLMVLAAVDIGRFLSEVVLKTYGKYRKLWERLMRACGCAEKKRQIVELVETKAIHVQSHTLHRSFKRSRRSSRRSHRHRSKSANPNSSSKGGAEANNEPTKRLPLSVNASILLIFCMLGGLVYLGAGGQKTFIEAFFVTFNLVANLTMAEMPNDLNHVLTLFYILIFVTFGLAVLSMCGELAASELKSLFLKIHYFGRKIDWRRNRREQLEVEVREMLKIIEAIRKRHPDKGKISSADILQYMHEMNDGMRSSVMGVKQERRDTIAFMPQTIEALKFADEMDLDDNSHRSTSRVEYEIHREPIGPIDI